MKVKFMK